MLVYKSLVVRRGGPAAAALVAPYPAVEQRGTCDDRGRAFCRKSAGFSETYLRENRQDRISGWKRKQGTNDGRVQDEPPALHDRSGQSGARLPASAAACESR